MVLDNRTLRLFEPKRLKRTAGWRKRSFRYQGFHNVHSLLYIIKANKSRRMRRAEFYHTQMRNAYKNLNGET
jgi:hypothetical protein